MEDRKLKLVINAEGSISALELDNPTPSNCLVDYSVWCQHAGKPDNRIEGSIFVPGVDVATPEPFDITIAEAQKLTDEYPRLSWIILEQAGFYKEGE